MYLTIDPPPGISRTGTNYKSKGRFFDANLWRWFAGTSGPVGGWRQHSSTGVSGKPRSLISWRENAGKVWAAIGTHTGLYVMNRSGTIFDVTPDDFTEGRPNAVNGAGFGSGLFGEGLFGTPRESEYQVLDASIWSLDTWAENLVGVMSDDGTIYEWTLNTGTPAEPLANAPTAAALVVTSDRILVALGAEDNPRRLKWSDREDNTDWTSTATNYAGEFDLQTPGKLMCGKRINGGTLYLTDVDVWLGTEIGQPLVYGFEKRGTNCGVISGQCVAVTDASVFWMSKNGFWSYNGFTGPLDCDVHDYVFSDINYTQASKVYAVHNSSFGEVWWFYCSATSDEIDRYVVYNYREQHWNKGELVRLCGTDRGVFDDPLMVGNDGYVYDHEVGWDHGGTSPFATTGPIEVGQGDRLFSIEQIIPDEKTLGAVEISFDAYLYPLGTPITYGPYTPAALTDARLTARHVEMTYTGTDGEDFKVGSFRLDGRPRGKR